MISNPWLAARLGICSGSLHPASVDDLIKGLREVELSRVQLWLDPLRVKDPNSNDTAAKLKAANVTIGSTVGGCVGEDYTTIDTIHKTGGVVPDTTWPATRENMKAYAAISRDVGVKLCTFHAGFIPNPEETGEAVYKVVDRINEV